MVSKETTGVGSQGTGIEQEGHKTGVWGHPLQDWRPKEGQREEDG